MSAPESLSFYTCDDLLDELERRFEDYAFVGRKILTNEEEEVSFRYGGNSFTVQGMMFDRAIRIHGWRETGLPDCRESEDDEQP